MDADLVASLPERYRGCPSFSFGDSPELANELAALVISGRKIATVNTLDAPDCPKLNELWIVLDGAGRPVCVIETIELIPRRFDEVDEAFAFDEGGATAPWPSGGMPTNPISGASVSSAPTCPCFANASVWWRCSPRWT